MGLQLQLLRQLWGLECDVYMGEVDIQKAMPNVYRMKILGANIISVRHGQMTLKEAVDAAFEAYLNEYETALYAIGSVVGPHPFQALLNIFNLLLVKNQENNL